MATAPEIVISLRDCYPDYNVHLGHFKFSCGLWITREAVLNIHPELISLVQAVHQYHHDEDHSTDRPWSLIEEIVEESKTSKLFSYSCSCKQEG